MNTPTAPAVVAEGLTKAPSMEARLILAAELESNPALSNSVAVLRYSTHPNPWHHWERKRLREIDARLAVQESSSGR